MLTLFIRFIKDSTVLPLPHLMLSTLVNQMKPPEFISVCKAENKSKIKYIFLKFVRIQLQAS